MTRSDINKLICLIFRISQSSVLDLIITINENPSVYGKLQIIVTCKFKLIIMSIIEESHLLSKMSIGNYVKQRMNLLPNNFTFNRYFNIFTGYDMYLPPVILAYLLFATKLGPWYMKDKKPLDLRNPMRIYNFGNMLINASLVLYCLRLTKFGTSFFNCEAITETYPTHLCDMILCSRLIDFLDTIFFVLRKKFNQVTLLHVSHHSLVPIAIYVSSSSGISVYSGFLVFINSIVHVFMYGYYFIATFPVFKRILWWKPYVTRIQIIQFIVSIMYYTGSYILLPQICGPISPIPTIVNLFLSVVFLTMFISFYSETYRRRLPSVSHIAGLKMAQDYGFVEQNKMNNNCKIKRRLRNQSSSDRGIES